MSSADRKSDSWIVVHRVDGKLKLGSKLIFRQPEEKAKAAALELNEAMQTDCFFAMNWSDYYRETVG